MVKACYFLCFQTSGIMSEIFKWTEPCWQPVAYLLFALKRSGHDRHFVGLLILARTKKTPYSHSSRKSTCSKRIFRFFSFGTHTSYVLHLFRGAQTPGTLLSIEASWNVMAHAQKPDFVFWRSGRVHLNRWGRQFTRLLAVKVCASAVVMLDTPCFEVVWRVLAT